MRKRHNLDHRILSPIPPSHVFITGKSIPVTFKAVFPRINSKALKVSSTYSLNEIWMKLKIWFNLMHRCICDPGKARQLICFPNTVVHRQRIDRHSILKCEKSEAGQRESGYQSLRYPYLIKMLSSDTVAHIAPPKGSPPWVTIYFPPSSLNLEKRAHPLLTPKRKQPCPLGP